MEGSDLGPNVIEIPVSKGAGQREPDTTQQSELSSSGASNVQLANTEPGKY
jgi:hypothetical protein